VDVGVEEISGEYCLAWCGVVTVMRMGNSEGVGVGLTVRGVMHATEGGMGTCGSW
jgi:hypothetical protein